MTQNTPTLERIALINFGGIGDAILFSPVINTVKKHFPNADLTLFLERRSATAGRLIDGLYEVRVVDIDHDKKTLRNQFSLFMTLLKTLRDQNFDAVISVGSNPMIPVLLYLTGIKHRIGFDCGPIHHYCLTGQAPLVKNRYAGAMYHALADAFLKAVGITQESQHEDWHPKLKALSPEEIASAKSRLKKSDTPTSNKKNTILIHPGVSKISVMKHILKGWPATKWATLIQRLLSNPDFNVVLLGGPDDHDMISAIITELATQTITTQTSPRFKNLYGETKSLLELAALIHEADVLVSVDSAPMHIAVGYQKSTVALFGPTDPQKLVPDDPRYHVETVTDLTCQPCLWDHRNKSCDTPVCLDVSVEAMAQAVYTRCDLPLAKA